MTRRVLLDPLQALAPGPPLAPLAPPPLQALAAATVLARLARGRRRRPPLAVPATPPAGTISAVVPARDEAARIGPCLTALLADPHLAEVVVVDDGSTDATAQLARRLGARAVPGSRTSIGRAIASTSEWTPPSAYQPPSSTCR